MSVNPGDGRNGRPDDDGPHRPLQPVAPMRYRTTVDRADDPEAHQDKGPRDRKGVLGDVENIAAMRAQTTGTAAASTTITAARAPLSASLPRATDAASHAAAIPALTSTPTNRAKLQCTPPAAQTIKRMNHVSAPSANVQPGMPIARCHSRRVSSQPASHGSSGPPAVTRRWGRTRRPDLRRSGPARPDLGRRIPSGDADRYLSPQKKRLTGGLPSGDAAWV